MIAVIEQPEPTLGDLLHRLGDIPASRILLEPPPGTATEGDVVRYLEAPRKRLCELIDGVLVEKAMGVLEGLFGLWIGRLIGNFVEEHDLGLVFGADSPFRFQLGLIRYPDASYISWERIPDEELPPAPVARIVPDLAVEVISEGNTKREMEMKLDLYFQSGVRAAWIIDPATKTASVYSSRRRVKHLGIDGEIDGGKVLPGFKLPLTDMFACPAAPSEKGDIKV